MALGGGTFLTQNKVLPGAYINFISTATATATLGDRGYAGLGLELDWGKEGEIFEVTVEDFQKNSQKIFGYSYAHEAMKGLREIFKNIQTLYAYKLNAGGKQASNALATAKYAGTRGNALKIAIINSIDSQGSFDVQTYLDDVKVDSQTVGTVSDLVATDYIGKWNITSLAVTAGTPLTGGTNGTVSADTHQTFLDLLESYPSINAVGCMSDDTAIKSLYASWCKRMRDSVGTKFQVVLHDSAADYEGVVNVKNTCTESDLGLIPWVTGVVAGTAVNASATNKKYDGEYTVNTTYTQSQLEAAIKAGEFTLHQVGSDVRILSDINSLVTTTSDKGDIFKDNQTIRVIDQIATDIASLFVTKYLGVIPNDASGRTSLWTDIVKHHQELETIRAIEDFSSDDVTVAQGDTKKAVVVTDAITVVNTMEKLYMTVYVA